MNSNQISPKTSPLASSDDPQIHQPTVDLQPLPLPGPSAAGCLCPFCCCATFPSWRLSVKRLLELDGGGEVAVCVEVENEVDALREAVAKQEETIQELCAELDEERNAAASAASEAMSMILRLQREKAEVQMDARQFKFVAEEKMEHDQQELLDLEELILKGEEAIQGLTLQLQAYRDPLIGHGIDPDDVDDTAVSGGDPDDDLGVSQFDEIRTVDYPPLKCNLPNDVENQRDSFDDATNLEQFAFGQTPHADENLDSLETCICELETSPGANDLLEIGVVEEGPESGPGQSDNYRSPSADSYNSIPNVELQEPSEEEEFPASMDRPSHDSGGADDVSDRVYTLDAVHEFATIGSSENCVDTQREKCKRMGTDGGVEGGTPVIWNLYMRQQALKADRESMKQTIISMRTEKAQLVLLRELAQQLYKDLLPERRIAKKSSSSASFSVVAVLKNSAADVSTAGDNEMSIEETGDNNQSADSMFQQSGQPGTSPTGPVFGVPAVQPASPVFQFVGQQNLVPPDPSQFQPSGSVEFPQGGSFALGSGGGGVDKSSRQIIRVVKRQEARFL